MTTEHHLQLPVGEEQSRQLRVGDIVYLSGVVHTMRDMGHRRAVDMFRRGERLPFELTNGTLWHCGPITRTASDGKWQVLSAGPTTSSRFNELGPELMRAFGVRCTIGKGSMGAEARDAIRELGGFFLNATEAAARSTPDRWKRSQTFSGRTWACRRRFGCCVSTDSARCWSVSTATETASPMGLADHAGQARRHLRASGISADRDLAYFPNA